MIWFAIGSFGLLVWLAIAFSYIAKSSGNVANTVHRELRPFALPSVFAQFAAQVASDDNGFNIGASATLVFQVAVWWFIIRSDDNDDDRWKRRRRKAAGKIKALASGKLVAEPT